MNAPWRIELFGGLQLFGDNGVVLSRFQTRKTGALLGYLAYYKEKPVSREVLADLFWPENDPEAARNSLRVALNSLRKQLEPPGIPPGGVLSADRATVRLNPHAVVTDSAEFERALKAERAANPNDEEAKTAFLLQAVDLYKGPLLSGWYEEWIDLEQTRLAEVYAGALRRLTSLLFKARDFDRALEFAQRAVQSDPLREENHRHLMRLYASLGRPDAALKAFRELESILRDEMNAPPSGVTRDLVKQIVALSSAPAQSIAHRSDVSPLLSEATEPSPPVAAATKPAAAAATALSTASFAEPPVSVSDAVGSVPLQWTRFWGRETEIARLFHLLQPSGDPHPAHLVTLSGPGGVGKTRLSVEVASRLRQIAYHGRVWFVPLDEIPAADAETTVAAHEARLLFAIARALRVPQNPGEAAAAVDSILEEIAGVLGGGDCAPALLVLDNVSPSENGVAAAASAVAHLREAVPCVRCLVTSRQRLNMASERELILEPFPVPVLPHAAAAGFSHAPDGAGVAAPAHLLETLSACPSVAFFVERAQAVRPDFQITPRNALAIAELCQRLDGLPLSLELAAAWSRLLTPAQMVERTTENCFALLSTERRDLALRHRSLQTVLTDACRDLPVPLRSFFAALSVFEGGWTLDAAQTVCRAPDGGNSGGDALSLLDALQARSLLSAHETEHGLRFRLLQTTRCFAQTLLSSTDRARLTDAFAEYHCRLAQAAYPFLGGSTAQTWRARLLDEQENLRGVLREACDPSAAAPVVERGLLTAACLWRYWYARGQSDEGAEWLQTLLRHPALSAGQTDPVLRARALHGAGRLLLNAGQAMQAGVLLGECLSLLPSETAAADEPFALNKTLIAKDLAIAARARGDLNAVHDALALVLHEQENANDRDAWGTASVLSEWGSDALLRGDAPAAQAAFARSALLRRAFGERWGAAEADAGQAQALAALGDTVRADALKLRASREMADLGDVHGIAASFLALGYVAAEQDDWEAALPLLRDAVSLFQTRSDHKAAALVWWIIARAAARQNEFPLAISAAENTLTESQSETMWASDVSPRQYPVQKMETDGQERGTDISLLAAGLLEQMAGRQREGEREVSTSFRHI